MIRIRLITLLFSLFALFYTSLLAQSSPNFLLDLETLSLLEKELSGEQAKEHVVAITRHHRISGSQGYTEAASYVLEQLHKFGFSPQEAWIESFTSDGKIQYQTWPSPSGWNISSAELRMIKPKNELIIRYLHHALCVLHFRMLNQNEPHNALLELFPLQFELLNKKLKFLQTSTSNLNFLELGMILNDEKEIKEVNDYQTTLQI